MSGKPKTHRERAALAAELALAVSKISDPLPGMTILITGETFPSELVKAASAAERYIAHAGTNATERGDEHPQSLLLADLRAALDLYEDKP